jgi:hypothetical protein
MAYTESYEIDGKRLVEHKIKNLNDLEDYFYNSYNIKKGESNELDYSIRNHAIDYNLKPRETVIPPKTITQKYLANYNTADSKKILLALPNLSDAKKARFLKTHQDDINTIALLITKYGLDQEQTTALMNEYKLIADMPYEQFHIYMDLNHPDIDINNELSPYEYLLDRLKKNGTAKNITLVNSQEDLWKIANFYSNPVVKPTPTVATPEQLANRVKIATNVGNSAGVDGV